ncbi:MAG TPA: hypothetical protein PLL20_19775 [Phycisphaerae bacterium]|nr:hypothetical protein [Phycisphaerae bacterium]HRR85179.1 hypothetical protein [Phycisphaerae bacterium]
MSAKTVDDNLKWHLLEDLSTFARSGVDEVSGGEDFFKTHLPIPEHRRVLDRDTLLVLGGRGTGKTRLFRALTQVQDPSDLLPGQSGSSQVRSDKYVKAFTLDGTTFPRPEVLQKDFVARGQDDDQRLQSFWLGLLAGALATEPLTQAAIKESLPPAVYQVLCDSLPDPNRWMDLVNQDIGGISSSLDRANDLLRAQSRNVVLVYDDLDRLVSQVSGVYPLVRQLLTFWLNNFRRWSSIRCKVFLRTDIFEADEVAFTDSSKYRPLSVTLQWTADNLYRLVLKRLVNGAKQEDWLVFVRGKLSRREDFRKSERWGLIPMTSESQHRSFMELLVGKWMGSDKRRGDTYRWFLNHLQDSLGNIAPRSFLKLFEFSASRQLRKDLPGAGHLLAPEEISGALTEVSKDRLQELREEYDWIDDIGASLKGKTVPMERGEFRRCLGKVPWQKLPDFLGEDKDRLVQYLISLGILRETEDKRIHVPDIYLFGLELRRKGGIRRPRV